MIRGPEWTGRVWLVGLVVVAISAVSAGVRYGEWIGSWGETSRAFETTTVLAYPAVAGVAAWFASAARRRRFDWMAATSSRDPLVLQLRLVALVAGPAILGSVAVCAVMSSLTAVEADFGTPPVAALGPVLVGYLAASCVGVVVARWLPTVISPVAAIVLVYAIEVLVDTGNPSLRSLASFIVADPRERTYLAAATWLLIAKASWLLAVSWLLLEASLARTTRWLVPFGACCLLAVPLLLTGDTGLKRVEAAYEPVCHAAQPNLTVCMSAGRDHTYKQVEAAVGPVQAKLRGLESRGWVFREETIAADPNPSYVMNELVVPFGVVSGVSGNSHRADPRMMQADIARRLLAMCPPSVPSPSAKPAATPQDVVYRWLLEQLDLPTDGSEGYMFPNLSDGLIDYSDAEAFMQSFESMSSEERAQWFESRGAALLSCDLTLTEANEAPTS